MRIAVLCLVGCLVTACGGGSSGGDSQNDTPPPAANSPATGGVTISGELQAQSTLTAQNTLADSDGLGTFTFQWHRGALPISGANSSTYLLTNTDVGETIFVEIAYIDGNNNQENVQSAPTNIITAAPSDPDPTPITQKNILLIISDDLGVDASAQYPYSSNTPNTPTLDSLATQGIVFDNVWATPACTTTRGTIMTGKHGVNSGISFVPAAMSSDEDTLLKRVKAVDTNTPYNTALVGKWHLGGPRAAALHPVDSGADYYAGILNSGVGDYFNWDFTTNGATTTNTDYHTTKTTDLAIDWINTQNNPWFLWVAYAAPHSPFHLPPASLHSRTGLSGDTTDINANTRDYYFAAIEAMDAEIGRLLDGMSQAERENTVVIYIGDNGTPARVIDRDVFIGAHSKGSLYEGGIRVPMTVSGAGVTRLNEREDALINSTDLFATIMNLAGETVDTIHDSTNFAQTFTTQDVTLRSHNYVEFESSDVTGWAVRNATHKLIEYEDGTQELYLTGDISEENNLLNSGDDTSAIVSELKAFALQTRGESSELPQDITNVILTSRSANCADYINHYVSSVTDVNNSTSLNGDLRVSHSDAKCTFRTNAIPNHDFNDGGRSFPNTVSAQDDLYQVTDNPTPASTPTTLSLRTDNAILLNGVKVDLLAAACFGVGDGKIGCNDINQPWRFDPMFEANNFAVDSHNAHSQGDGTYHYHGKPEALYDDSDDSNPSPVIGFAADGYPIYGPYFNDSGVIRKATSSYRLKSGNRPTGDGNPGGVYDGTYRDDWEYVDGAGDLDACNGMTVDGVYSYFVTDTFPHVIACFTGTPDASFNK